MDAPPNGVNAPEWLFEKTIIQKRSVRMQCKVIGIDLAKNTFQVCVLGIDGSGFVW